MRTGFFSIIRKVTVGGAGITKGSFAASRVMIRTIFNAPRLGDANLPRRLRGFFLVDLGAGL